ncbi:MAG: AIR synthase-related protein, partial [bacterium]
MKKLHYEQFGDNYKLKDPYKLIALSAAEKTAKNLKRFKKYGIEVVEEKNSRGDSAYRILIKSPKPVNFQLVHVEESIGTKNIIADELAKINSKSYYFNIAIDNVASIVNDLSTSGASPLSFMLHIAAFPNEWYLETARIEALMEGTAYACNMAGMSWGGGESGTDRDIIYPGKCLLSGSATGLILPAQKALSESKLKEGDCIIVFASSGVHTNGITLLRSELLKRLSNGYETKLLDGRTYGNTLLDPSVIYSRLIEDLVHKTELHYAVHITGHGWRKIMRAKKAFTYEIDQLPEPQPVFKLIQEYAKLSDREMYDTYNMGGGYAVFVPQSSVNNILKISEKHNIPALLCGRVKKGPR